jgi:hypothetical protein
MSFYSHKQNYLDAPIRYHASSTSHTMSQETNQMSLDRYDLSPHLIHMSQETNHISRETFDLSLDLSPYQNYHVLVPSNF